jgi:hypothetical protein
MWKVVLGFAVLLNAGGASSAEPSGPSGVPPATESPLPIERVIPPGGAAPEPAPGSVEAVRATDTTLMFKNNVGDKYTLVEARFVMDGETLPMVPGGAERGKPYVVYTGATRPGRHILTTHLTYQGRSRGPFTYTKGYTFKVTSDEVLTLPSDRNVNFTIVSKEVKGLKAPVTGRMAITVEENVAPSR